MEENENSEEKVELEKQDSEEIKKETPEVIQEQQPTEQEAVVEEAKVEESKAEETNETNEGVTEEVTEESKKEKGKFKFSNIFSIGKNKKLMKIISGILGALILILVVVSIFSRSPKAVVKQYVNLMQKGKASKITSIIDYDGLMAYSKARKTEDFDEEYKDLLKEIKEMDKEDREDYKETKDKFKEYMEKSVDQVHDEFENDDIKLSVKIVESKKVKGSKYLTKVKAKVTKKEGKDKDVSTVEFYTIKKGVKSYIVYTDSDLL